MFQTTHSNTRLTARNPGQFYHNASDTGTGTANFTINIPYPFVTQGANPIHVYSSLNTGPDGCLIPGTDVTSAFTISTPTITWADWNGKTFGDTSPMTVNGPSEGFLHVNIHLDYGLKKNIGNLDKDTSGNTFDHTTLDPKIDNGEKYSFSVSGAVTDTQAVYNMNEFKKNPGVRQRINKSI